VLVRALEGKGIKSIQCGYDFAAAINVEGHLFTCTLPPAGTTLFPPLNRPRKPHLPPLLPGGHGLGGRLGHGDEENRTVPTLVTALAEVPIRAIACGAGHMAAISGTDRLSLSLSLSLSLQEKRGAWDMTHGVSWWCGVQI
jgi:hypothetical protein